MLGADGVHLGRDRRRRRPRARAGPAARAARRRTSSEARRRRTGRLHRRRAGLGDAVEARCRPADRARRARAQICAAVAMPVVAIGGIDATNAGDCIRAGAAGVAVIRAAPRPRRSGARSMRLSELGELGLLAELERRGLAAGIEHDAAAARRRPSSSRRTRSSRASTSGSTGSRGATSAGAPPRSTSATSPPRAPSRTRSSSRSPRPARRRSTTCSSSTPACTRPGVPVRRRRHDRARAQVVLSVTALGRSERVPGPRRARGRATCSS